MSRRQRALEGLAHPLDRLAIATAGSRSKSAVSPVPVERHPKGTAHLDEIECSFRIAIAPAATVQFSAQPTVVIAIRPRPKMETIVRKPRINIYVD